MNRPQTYTGGQLECLRQWFTSTELTSLETYCMVMDVWQVISKGRGLARFTSNCEDSWTHHKFQMDSALCMWFLSHRDSVQEEFLGVIGQNPIVSNVTGSTLTSFGFSLWCWSVSSLKPWIWSSYLFKTQPVHLSLAVGSPHSLQHCNHLVVCVWDVLIV